MAKPLRADLLAQVLGALDVPLVLYSCGHAVEALLERGFTDVLWAKAPEGVWYDPLAVRAQHPGRIDVTSGHLPQALVEQLGRQLRDVLWAVVPASVREGYTLGVVATGSGETLAALRHAWPRARWVPWYCVPGLPGATEPPPWPAAGLYGADVQEVRRG